MATTKTTTKTCRYHVEIIRQTCADRLVAEVLRQMARSYASASGAVRGWSRAVAQVDRYRRAAGYTPVSWPAVRAIDASWVTL
jgi:hypothetical protein